MSRLSLRAWCGSVCESGSDWVVGWGELVFFCAELQFIVHSEEVQRTWAESKDITVINMKDAHAEESLIKSGKGITEIEASRPVYLDCKNLINEKGVKSKTPCSGKKSRKRRNIGKC